LRCFLVIQIFFHGAKERKIYKKSNYLITEGFLPLHFDKISLFLPLHFDKISLFLPLHFDSFKKHIIFAPDF